MPSRFKFPSYRLDTLTTEDNALYSRNLFELEQYLTPAVLETSDSGSGGLVAIAAGGGPTVISNTASVVMDGPGPMFIDYYVDIWWTANGAGNVDVYIDGVFVSHFGARVHNQGAADARVTPCRSGFAAVEVGTHTIDIRGTNDAGSGSDMNCEYGRVLAQEVKIT